MTSASSRSKSTEPRKQNAKENRPSSATAACESTGRPAPAAASSRKSLAAVTPRMQTAKFPAPTKAPPSAAAARSAARAERQASKAQGASRSKGATDAPPGSARAGVKKAAPGRAITKKCGKNRQSVGTCLEMMAINDKEDEPRDGEEEAQAQRVDDAEAENETPGEGEDLMAYLMPIADEDSAEEAEDAEDGTDADGALATNAGSEGSSGCEGGETNTDEGDDVAPQQEHAENPAHTGETQSGESVKDPLAVVTPQVRKVLASSEIFTPESSCEASPGVCGVLTSLCVTSGSLSHSFPDLLSVCVMS